MTQSGFGICFDVDGVIYRKTGKQYTSDGKATHAREPVSGAKMALQKMRNLSVPHIFMSNDSGDIPSSKASQIRAMFPGHSVESHQLILPGTCAKDCIELRGFHKLIVAISAERAYKLCKHAGWKLGNCIAVQDFGAAHPQLCPFVAYDRVITDEIVSKSNKKIDAIVLLMRPDDWHSSLQIVTDILRFDGFREPQNVVSTANTQLQHPKVFCCNPDFDYGAAHSVPRLTLGAFVRCLDSIYETYTGKILEIQNFGKPFSGMYEIAQNRLEELSPSIQRIYMIGDNPKSDIQGANRFGGKWVSVLVRTGCFKGSGNDKTHPAHFVCDDVGEAVSLILEREGSLMAKL